MCGHDSLTRESGLDLPGRGGDTTQCRRPRPGKLQQGSRRSRRRQYQPEVKRRRDLDQRRDIRNGYSGRQATLGWRIKERIRESRSPGKAGGGTWGEMLSEDLCTYVVYSVVSTSSE